MILQLGQVMLYVENLEQAKAFWTEKLGFEVISDVDNGLRIITIAPTEDAHTQIVLHDKKKIQQMSPELNLATPSLMFYGENLEALYEQYKAKGITVGELVSMGFAKIFNFADDEGNYFAITEK